MNTTKNTNKNKEEQNTFVYQIASIHVERMIEEIRSTYESTDIEMYGDYTEEITDKVYELLSKTDCYDAINNYRKIHKFLIK